MLFIDTHSHIYGEEFNEDREEVISRAVEAGAEKILLPNIDEESIGQMLSLCDAHPDICLPMMGLQPEELPENPALLLDKMEALLDAEPQRYVAVGEVGIDLYWDASRKEEQIEAFKREIGWCIKYHLPLVIHARAAHRELVDTLAPFKAQLFGGIFHCFGGTEEEARELLDFPDFYLGIGGVVTFKKSKLPEVLQNVVPLSRIVLETDAPYLTPVPHRGKRNEPAYIPFIIQKLAEVYNVAPEEIAATTTANAKRLFHL